MTERETARELNDLARRGTGFAIWRQIAEQLRRDIIAGNALPGTRLPTESALAARFGVNRHTVRAALASLIEERLIEARRGSGTFVTNTERLVHTIGLRTRLTDSLESQGASSGTRMLSSRLEQPDVWTDRVLELDGRQALRLESVRLAGDRPISRGTHWFDPERVPHIADDYQRLGSITTALAEAGITDYLRTSTTVTARHADAEEAHSLALAAGAIVLVVRSTDSFPTG